MFFFVLCGGNFDYSHYDHNYNFTIKMYTCELTYLRTKDT